MSTLYELDSADDVHSMTNISSTVEEMDPIDMDQTDLNSAIASIQAQGLEDEEEEEEQGEVLEEEDQMEEQMEEEEEQEVLVVDEDGLAPLPNAFGLEDDESVADNDTQGELALGSTSTSLLAAPMYPSEDSEAPDVPIEELSARETPVVSIESSGLEGKDLAPVENTSLPNKGEGIPLADRGMTHLPNLASNQPIEQTKGTEDQTGQTFRPGKLNTSKDTADPAPDPALQEPTSRNNEAELPEDQTSVGSPLTPLPELPKELPLFDNNDEAMTSSAVPGSVLDPALIKLNQRALNGFQDLPAESSSMSTSRSPPPSDGGFKTAAKKSGPKRPRGSGKTARVTFVKEEWEVELAGDLDAKGSSDGASDNDCDNDRDRKKKKKDKGGSRARAGGGTKRKTIKEAVPNGYTAPQIPRVKIMTDAQLKMASKGKTKEVQYSTCLRPRYGPWGKCSQCIAKVAGDSCRFRGNRVFRIEPETGDIIGIAPYEPTNWEAEMTPLPTVYNIPLEEKHILRTERTVAPLLLPLIARELKHSITRKAVTRVVDAAVHRSVCDFCSSTVFGGYFFCRICGRDFCLQCENYFPDSRDAIGVSRWPLPDASRPRLLRCTGGPPGGYPDGSTVTFLEDDSSKDDSLKAGPAEAGSGENGLVSDSSELDQTKVPTTLDQVENSTSITADGTSPTIATVESATLSGRQEEDDVVKPIDLAEGTPVAERPDSIPPTSEATLTIDSVLTNGSHNPDNGDDFRPPRRRAASKRSAIESHTPDPRPPTTTPKVHHHHTRSNLQPVSRFPDVELRENWESLVDFVLNGTGPVEERLSILGLDRADKEVDQDLLKSLSEMMAAQDPEEAVNGAPDPTVLTDEEVAKFYTKHTKDPACVMPIPDPAGLENLSLPFIFIKDSELDNGKFDILWGKGEPIVVDGVGQKFKLDWTPDTFIEEYGSEPCNVIDCQSSKSIPTTVAKFFQLFKKPSAERSTAVLKVKDWPSSADFQSAYPKLYNDFCDSLPVPDYTKRNGVLNLYSHFPPGITRPDIGPKMYNAFEAMETTGGFGSTRLHMDVADAINIMLYASPRADSQPGCAVWDLYRAEDADKIRLFLRSKFDKAYSFTDPIHSQLFYLDASLRKELLEKHGVVSWRVYQYPGQAVFIPAGCAHQVCNLADCIKIALDFVSPHNVTRCQQLTKDFRNENFVMAWKEDVLQLYNIMWFAWISCRETRKRREEDEKKQQAQQAVRAAHLLALQNGRHDSFVNGGGPLLSPAVSSVRDGPIPPGLGVKMDVDKTGRSIGGVVNGLDGDRSVNGHMSPKINGDGNLDISDSQKISCDAASGSSSLMFYNRASATSEDAQDVRSGEGKTSTLDPALTDRLLNALLTRPDPIPTPPKPSQAVKAGYNFYHSPNDADTGSIKTEDVEVDRSTPKPRIANLIRLGALPLDLAVAAARAAMGEGDDFVDADEEEEEDEQLREVEMENFGGEAPAGEDQEDVPMLVENGV